MIGLFVRSPGSHEDLLVAEACGSLPCEWFELLSGYLDFGFRVWVARIWPSVTGERIELSARDRAVFFDVLMNPPEPNDRLVRAAMASKARIEPDAPRLPTPNLPGWVYGRPCIEHGYPGCSCEEDERFPD